MENDNRALTYSEMRVQNLFTDAVVKSSSGREWDVHKVVMSRAGKYFCTAFTFPWFCGTLNLAVSDEVVQVIIDLAYEGACHVQVENVLEVLRAAFMYQLESLIEICMNLVLVNMISFEHVLDLKLFLSDHKVVLKTFKYGDLMKNVDKFIRRNFIDLCERDSIYKLSVEDIEDYIKEDDTNIPEEALLEVVLKYVKLCKLSTEKASQLLTNVRFVLIDSVKLSKLSNESLCTEIATKVKLGKTKSSYLPRYPRDIVLVTGGMLDGQNYQTEIFNMRTNEWKLIEMNDISPDVILGNIFYEFRFLGNGYARIKSLDISSGHSVTEKFSRLPLDLELEYVEMLGWNGGVFVFMGHNNAAYYNPTDNSWTQFPSKIGVKTLDVGDGNPMTIPSGVKSVVVGDHLISIGGYHQDGEEPENGIGRKIEYLDTLEMCWVLCGYLKKNPKSLRIEVVDGKVYVISMTEQYAECFQPTWEAGRMHLIWFPNIQRPWRYGIVETSVVDNKILFTGGIQENKKEENYDQRECNIFCPRTGEWSRLADLNYTKVGHKAFTINISEFDVARIEQLCKGELVIPDDES